MGETRHVDTKEAAALLGVSIETVYNYIRRKKLRTARPGAGGARHVRGGAPHRIPIEDVEALLRAAYVDGGEQ